MKSGTLYRFQIYGLLTCLAACSTSGTARAPSSHMDHMGTGAPTPACTQWSNQISAAQQQVINEIIATRSHRLQHALWHATRAGLEPQESQEVQSSFGPTWSQYDRLCPPPTPNSDASNYNPAGEDFLFMHREMIEMLQAGFVAKGVPCIAGWKQVPTPTDWPLPDQDRTGPKSNRALAQLQAWDSKLRDPAWLKTVSMSQLGVALEFTVHNNLHMRYATTQPPKGFDGVAKTGGAPIPYNGHYPSTWTYDDPAYNWLADPYGAAVNPTFWKIHGYVDQLIDLWLAANNYRTVARDCSGQDHCYQWKGTWTGEIPQLLTGRKGVPDESSPAPSGDAVRFNQKRMLFQWRGVLTEAKLSAPRRAGTPGQARGAPAVVDPFVTASQDLCAPQH